MKKLKSILLILLAAALVIMPLEGTRVNAADKVKVYIFEAGGCPYCEAEVEYLKQLDSYDKKFEIVIKELYVDHVDWEQGKDYDLGVAVADAFYNEGFTEASYQGTPFVVISNIYAATAYSTSLEEYINKAYDEGDVDVVGCIEKGGEDCLKGAAESNKTDKSRTIKNVLLIAFIAGVLSFVIVKTKKDSANELNKDEEKVVIKEKEEVKKEEKKSEKKVTKETTKKGSGEKKAKSTSKKKK